MASPAKRSRSRSRSPAKGKGKKKSKSPKGHRQPNAWQKALKDFNAKQKYKGKVWCIPKKGSPQYNEVKKLMKKYQ